MGSHFSSDEHRGNVTEATVTPREYVRALSAVVAALFGDPPVDRLLAGAVTRHITGDQPAMAVRLLAAHLSRHPEDAAAHRLMGFAQLHMGDLPTALRHLGFALAPRPREQGLSLEEDLRRHCERALARLTLLLLYSTLGWRQAIERVADDMVC